MPDIRELIAHFDDDSSEDQQQLIELISRIVEPTFRRALARWNMPIQELDDLRQEFFKERVQCNWKALKEFRGTTEASFVAYWQEIAWRFGVRHLEKRVKRQQRESEAVASHIPRDGPGASEAEILARVAEVEALLTAGDRRLLQSVLEPQQGIGRPLPNETVPPGAGEDGPSEHGPSRHAWLTRIARLRQRIERFLRREE